MSLVRLDNVSKSFTGEPVLEGVDFRVEEGEKIGLIGRNGTGKSTLFNIIRGAIQPDSGKVERMRKARFASLAQFPDFPADTTVHDVVMTGFEELRAMEQRLRDLEHEMAAGNDAALEEYSHLQDEFTVKGGYEYLSNAERVLTGLGFRTAEFELPVSALSGGQRTRLMLAIVLLQDADLLLLDEPENHLDLEAREWLEGFLRDWPRAFVVVSHDRRTLNAVAQRIVEVELGGVRSYAGNYDAYVKEKALLREQQQKAFERQQQFIEKEERLINRFRYKASKARQMQSRQKKLEKMERLDAPPPEASEAKFRLGDVVRSGAVVLRGENLSMAYDGLQLYHDVNFEVQRGERVGIIGPNGTGKSTLLRQLYGKLPEGKGEVTIGHKVSIGFYDQHHENLTPSNDILTEISRTRPDMSPEAIRTFMGRFLFVGEDIFKPISALSGGERARVAIAKLILEGANLLLLDEPTNHLDIASREALEPALEAYPGTIVMISHDRELIDRLVDKLIIIENGTAQVCDGNYTFYRWKRGAALEEKAINDDVMKVRRNEEPKQEKKRADQKERRRQKKQFDELERQIETMELHITELEGKFAKVDPADYQKLQELQEERDGLKADLAEMYAEWERLAEEVSS